MTVKARSVASARLKVGNGKWKSSSFQFSVLRVSWAARASCKPLGDSDGPNYHWTLVSVCHEKTPHILPILGVGDTRFQGK